eukprot:TRINITY_DN156_c0_g1_i1.p2 TRINITY_DN156_c0_g1~~TRINITY_DN156_c0_g1_i1.p2  ORF type:complete len:125 (-),score=26.99 TRINITY_DN156_c0_g1_i1:151-495(-)
MTESLISARFILTSVLTVIIPVDVMLGIYFICIGYWTVLIPIILILLISSGVMVFLWRQKIVEKTPIRKWIKEKPKTEEPIVIKQAGVFSPYTEAQSGVPSKDGDQEWIDITIE